MQIFARHVAERVRVIEKQIHFAVTVAQVVGLYREVSDQIAAQGIGKHQLQGAGELLVAERCQRQLQPVALVEDAGLGVAAPFRFPGHMHRRAAGFRRGDQQGAPFLDVLRAPAEQDADGKVGQERLPLVDAEHAVDQGDPHRVQQCLAVDQAGQRLAVALHHQQRRLRGAHEGGGRRGFGATQHLAGHRVDRLQPLVLHVDQPRADQQAHSAEHPEQGQHPVVLPVFLNLAQTGQGY